MRFILPVLLPVLLLVLASCATPRIAPDSHTDGVFTPGKPVIQEDGSFVSRAAVHAGDDIPLARKAVWMRLLALAGEGGYGWFTMGDETVDKLLLHRVTVSGRLFVEKPEGSRIWPVEEMTRLASGLPPREEKPVLRFGGIDGPAQIAAAQTLERAAAGGGTSEATRRAVEDPATPVLEPNGVPVGFIRNCTSQQGEEGCAMEATGETTGASEETGLPAAPDATSGEEPLVIMAPEDITGSVSQHGSPARQPSGTNVIQNLLKPSGNAVSGIPSGVVYRR